MLVRELEKSVLQAVLLGLYDSPRKRMAWTVKQAIPSPLSPSKLGTCFHVDCQLQKRGTASSSADTGGFQQRHGNLDTWEPCR